MHLVRSSTPALPCPLSASVRAVNPLTSAVMMAAAWHSWHWGQGSQHVLFSRGALARERLPKNSLDKHRAVVLPGFILLYAHHATFIPGKDSIAGRITRLRL